jgi:hypothetical protein
MFFSFHSSARRLVSASNPSQNSVVPFFAGNEQRKMARVLHSSYNHDSQEARFVPFPQHASQKAFDFMQRKKRIFLFPTAYKLLASLPKILVDFQ